MIIILLILSVFLPEKFNRGVSVDAKKQKWTEITDRINRLGENHREVRPSVLLRPSGPITAHLRLIAPSSFLSDAADNEEVGGPEVRREAAAAGPAGPQRLQPEEEASGPGGADGAPHPEDESI